MEIDNLVQCAVYHTETCTVLGTEASDTMPLLLEVSYLWKYMTRIDDVNTFQIYSNKNIKGRGEAYSLGRIQACTLGKLWDTKKRSSFKALKTRLWREKKDI